MKYFTGVLLLSIAVTYTQAQTKPSTAKKPTTAAKPANPPRPAVVKTAMQEPVPVKKDTVVVVPKKVLPSLNIDKYISYPSEEAAIREIDSLYPNTVIGQIENPQNALLNGKFELVYHLLNKYEVMPGLDYLHNLNKYDFVCGVGLKRTKDVSPACAQPKVYLPNPTSDSKAKLARMVLSRGVKADYNSVSMCVGKNELELFKVLYASLTKENNTTVDGEKLLVEASDYGCYDIVKYLLDNNVSPNAYDHSVEQQDFKFYAIYRAVKYPEIFFLLTDKGADINIQGYRNTTTIIHAAREGCIEVLQYLLDKGISPYEKQGDMTAYEMAKKYNQKNKKEVVQLLEKYKSK
jgi:Ankyrin repeat